MRICCRSLGLLVLGFMLGTSQLDAQITIKTLVPLEQTPDGYKKLPMRKVPLGGTINALEQPQTPSATLKNSKVIHEHGWRNELKEEYEKAKEAANANAQAPVSGAAHKTSLTDPPIQGSNFFGNSTDGIPNDNDLAVSNDGEIVSVTNSRIHMYSETGTALYTNSLDGFSAGVSGIPNTKFDPRVIYDSNNDRFVVVYLNGTNPNNSKFIMAFSETGDPSGNWNIYTVAPSTIGTSCWMDYPQIAISDYELTVSGFLIDPQDQAVGQGVWQFRLADGYAGIALTSQSYLLQNVSLTPVQGAMGTYGSNMYILGNAFNGGSNLLVYEVTDTIGVGTLSPTPSTFTFPISYGVPPDADQRGSSIDLTLGDSRVMGAYYQNSRIEMVWNSAVSGKPGVFHGTLIISPILFSFSQVKAKTLSIPDLSIGYPNIAYGGSQDASTGENSSFLTFLYCSPNDYPGHGIVFQDTDGQYSDMKRLRDGSGGVGFGSSPFRWGDYVGIDERENTPGEVWVGASFGNSFFGTGTYISQVSPAAQVGRDTELAGENGLQVYPNPVTNYVRFEFPVAEAGLYRVNVLDAEGRLIRRITEEYLRKGDARVGFETSLLPAGLYFAEVSKDGSPVTSEKFVVQH